MILQLVEVKIIEKKSLESSFDFFCRNVEEYFAKNLGNS